QGTRQPFGNALPSASSKLRAMASAELLPRELDQTITRRNRGKKDYSHHQSAILQLVEAIIRRRTCRVAYQSPGNEPKTYSYHPYRLLAVDGGLYCLGRVPNRGDLT